MCRKKVPGSRESSSTLGQAEAVFIDNVTDGSTKKRQRQLGQNAPRTEWAFQLQKADECEAINAVNAA